MARIGFSDNTNPNQCRTPESAIWGFLVRRMAAIGLLSTGLIVAPLRAGSKIAPELDSFYSKETVDATV